MATHSFNTELAAKVGITAAVVLNNIYFWTQLNAKQKKNFYAGKYWTFNSYAGLAAVFTYLSARQVRSAIAKLCRQGLLLTARPNLASGDRTTWYSLSDAALALLEDHVPNSSDHVPNLSDHALNSSDHVTEKSDHVSNLSDLVTNLSDGGCLEKQSGIGLNGNLLYTDINTDITTDNNQDVNTQIKRPRAKKIAYAELVAMTSEEYAKLTAKYGEAATREMIEMLDSYKGSKGVKYKDDYRAVLSWVVDKYREKHQKKPLQSQWQGKNNAEAGYRGALELLGVET